MILDGKLVSEHIDKYTKKEIEKNREIYKSKYVAFILFEESTPSRAYIKMKQKKAESFGIYTKLIKQTELKNPKKAIGIIKLLNNDKNCIGILVQLPINKELKKYQGEILGNIKPLKDIDGLGGVMFGLSQIDYTHFLPATVRAIFEILDFYKIKVAGKNVSIFGQSNLVGKPFACECIRQLATVNSFNEFSDIKFVKKICKESDIIISATGKTGMIDKSFLSKEKTQILIDVGWGHKNGKIVGDFDFENINTKNLMYTPVPGGVGPVTVSSIFANLVDLQKKL